MVLECLRRSKLLQKIFRDSVIGSFLGEKLIYNMFNFVFNILMLHLIAEKYGNHVFAYYSFVLAIPSILVFADLGLGLVVFNHFNKSIASESIKVDTQIRFVTNSVVLLSLNVIVVIITCFFITIYSGWFFLFGSFANYEHRYIYSIVICLIFISQIPALSHEILTAAGRASVSMRIIFANSLTNFLFCMVLVNSNFFSIEVLILFPSVFQLSFALYCAHRAGMWKYLHISKENVKLKPIVITLNHGLISLMNLTIISFTLQFPRLYLNHHGTSKQILEVTKLYSLLIPISSLIFSFVWILAVSIGTSDIRKIIRQTLVFSGWVFGFASLATSVFSDRLVSLPSISSFLPASLTFVTYSLVCAVVATKTDYKSQRALVKKYLPLGIFLMFGLIFGPSKASLLSLILIQSLFLLAPSSILLSK